MIKQNGFSQYLFDKNQNHDKEVDEIDILMHNLENMVNFNDEDFQFTFI